MSEAKKDPKVALHEAANHVLKVYDEVIQWARVAGKHNVAGSTQNARAEVLAHLNHLVVVHEALEKKDAPAALAAAPGLAQAAEEQAAPSAS